MTSRFYPQAEQDISKIVAYIEQYNLAAAERFVLVTRGTADSLCDMPGMGPWSNNGRRFCTGFGASVSKRL